MPGLLLPQEDLADFEAPGSWAPKKRGLPGLLLGTEEEFQEELRRRGLQESYQRVLSAWGGDPGWMDDPLWLRKKYQDMAVMQELAPNLPPEVTAAGYAAMNKLDPDDIDGRLALLMKEAQKIDRQDGLIKGSVPLGAQSHLSGEKHDLDSMTALLKEQAAKGADRAYSLRGFNYGRDEAAKHFSGEIPVRARQAVWILRNAMGASTENIAGWRPGGKPIPEDVTTEVDEDAPAGTYDQDAVLDELATWFVNQSEDDRNKWGAAVKMLATMEGDVEPGFWKRAGQILDQPLAKAASAIGQAGLGLQATLAKGAELATGDLVKKLPFWSDSESLERGADWWSMRSRMWNFLDRDIAPWVDLEGAGDMKKGLYSGYESWPFFAMAALGGSAGLASGGVMEAGMVDQELREQYGDDIPDEVRMSIALSTGAINAALERWAWKGTAWSGRVVAKNWINPVYQGMRKKGMRQMLKSAGVTGFAARSTRGLAALGGATAIEWAEESVQDLTKATLSELAEAVVPDLMPEHSWKEAVKEWGNHHGVRFWAVLPYAILGAGGRAIKQRSSTRFLKGMLTDREGLRESGVFADNESLEAFAEEAKRDPVVAADEFQELHQAGDGDTRNLNRDNLTNEEARRLAEENDQPVINQQATGGYLVIVPGQEAYKAENLVEAKEIAGEAIAAKDTETLGDLPALIKQQEESKAFHDPEVIEAQAEQEKAKRPMTVTDLQTGKDRIAKPGEVSEERKRAWELEHGRPWSGEAARILGAAQAKRGEAGVAHAVLKLYRGASPITFTEEQAEGFLKVSLENGDIELEDARQRLAALGRDLGMDFGMETTEGVIEAFSELAVAYVSGSLTPEDLNSLPAKFADWLRRFAELLARSLRMVQGLREARLQGELDSTLEGWVREAVGLDPLQSMEVAVEEQTKKLEEENAALDEPVPGLSLEDLLFSKRWAQQRDEEFQEEGVVWAQSEEEAALLGEEEADEQMLAEEEQRAREAQYGTEEVDQEEAQAWDKYQRWEKKMERLYYKRKEFDDRPKLDETPFYDAVLAPYGMKVLSESQAKARKLWHKGTGEWDGGKGLGPARVKGAAVAPGAKKKKGQKVAVAGGTVPQHYMKMLWPKDGAPAHMPSDIAHSLASSSLTSHLVEGSTAQDFWNAFLNAVEQDQARKAAGAALDKEEAALEKEGAEFAEETFAVRATPGVDTRMIVTKDKTVLGPATFAIAGFHGTHSRVHPAFDMTKVGEGIGAQVWGYGLYFGGALDIGEEYAKMLARQHSPYEVANERHSPSSDSSESLEAVSSSWFVKDKRTGKRVTGYMTVDEADKAFDRLSLEAMNQYKVELDVEPEQLIFADTPFSKQSKFVQETLQKLIPSWAAPMVRPGTAQPQAVGWHDRSHVYPFDDEHVKELLQLTWDEEFGSYMTPDGTAVEITQWARSKGMIARKVSEALLKAGIKGIAYEESTTKGAMQRFVLREEAKAAGRSHIPWQRDSSSQSYVIFDDKDIKILEENGKPITLEEHPESYSVAPRFTPPPGVAKNVVELKKKGKPTKEGPLPTWTVPKDNKQSLGKKILAASHSKDGTPGKAVFDRLDLAREMVADDPGRLSSSAGWVETMRAAGVWGNILVPPGLMKTIVERPSQYVGLLEGGYHEGQTKPGVYQAAREGLNWTKKMGRELSKTGAVPEWNTVLHHFWGLLSRRATPVQQEAMWLRMLTHRPILDAIQQSINGTFSAWAEEQFKTNRKELQKKTRQMRTNDKGKVRPLKPRDAWIALVIDAREATAAGSALPGGAPMGNNVTSNANDFYAMLAFWDGRWGEVSNVYWTNDSIEMGRRFHSLGDDAVGIQNKVQRFVGLTYGIPGLIMDRWKFVEFWLPDLMKLARVRKPKNFFTYGRTEASRGTPEDPSSLYGFYSLIESQNPVFSLAFYEMMETGLEVAIDNSPELKRFLGPNANVGGLHWHGWNAIKNEAVGHSSLDLSLDLLRNYGLKSNAAAVEKTIKAGNYYTETQKADGTVERFTISKGVPSASRQERVPDGPRDRALGRRADAKGPGRGRRKDSETYAIAEHRQAEARGDKETGQRLVDEAAANSPFTMPVWHGSRMHATEGPMPAFPAKDSTGRHSPHRLKQLETGRAMSVYFVLDPGDIPYAEGYGPVRKYFINPGRVADLTRETNSPEYQRLVKEFLDFYKKEGAYLELTEERREGAAVDVGFEKFEGVGVPTSWEMWDDPASDASDFLRQGDYDAFILEERYPLEPSAERPKPIYSVAILDPSRVKSGEPFTYEWDPAEGYNFTRGRTLVPLDERFDPNIPDVSYAIAPGEAFDPLLEAISDKISDSAEGVVPFLEKMRDRIARIKAQYESDRASLLVSESYDEGGAEIDFEGGVKTGGLDLQTALAYLGAIQKVLPREIQSFAGSARRLADFKTIESMELELSRRIPRIESAIETYLARSHRKSIRKILKAGAAKVGNSRKAAGKIGPAGHAIFKEAKVAMGLQLTEDEKKADRTLQEKGEEMAQGLLDQIEDNDSLTLDEVDELDGRAAAWLLFTGYQEADSQRLREGLDLLNDVYQEGREKWLRVLGARKAERESRLQAMETMLKDKSRAGRAESMRVDEGALRRLSEGFMAAFLSGSQTIRRLAELSPDPVVRALVEEMEEALAFAENQETDLDYQDNEAFSEALYRILEVKYEHQLSRKINKHASAPDKEVPVSSLEGRKTRVYSVSKMEAERISNGEATGFTSKKEWVEINLAIRSAIEKAWAEFEELSEEEQKSRRVLKIEVVEATGDRKSLGRRTNFELLNLWLTMRQPDQAEKLHRLGYDEITQRELQAHLPDEVMALGLWMADYLRQDTGVVNRIHRAEKGISLNLVENYWPVRNDVSGQTYDDLNLDGNQKQEGRSVSFTMQRVTNNAEPAIADALGVFLAHRSQVNFWKSHVAALREWGGLVKHDRFSNVIRRTMGDAYYQSLSQRMERVGNGGVMRAGRALAFDRLIKNLKRRTSLGILGLRVSTIMVNFTAATNAFLEIPAKELLKGLLLASKRPGAWKEAWNSPAIRRRMRDGSSYEAQIAKARGPSKRPIISQLEKTAEHGVTPINYADTGANMIGAVAVYEYARVNALGAGATEEEAKLEGDRAVDRLMRRAAQPTARHQRSEMEMRALENPLAALFALFVSEPRKNLSIAVLAARQLATGKGVYKTKAMAAQAFTSSTLLLLALEHMLRLAYQAVFRADDDDEEEVLARFLDKITDAKAWAYRLGAGHAAGIPIVGPSYEWMVAHLVNVSSIPGEDVFQFTSTENPAMRALQKAGSGAKKIIEPKDDASKVESIDATIDLVQAGGQLVPGGPIFSQLANLGEAALGFNSSNISQEDRRGRVKGRFNKYKKGLDERLGPTTNKKTGDIDRDIQTDKWEAQAAYLLEALAPLAEEDIIKITQDLTIPSYVREEIEFGLLNGLDTTTIEDEK